MGQPLGEGAMTFLRLMATVIVLGLWLAVPAGAQAVGQVIDVRGGANLTSRGGTTAVRNAMPISNGDTIRTDRNGHVEIRFADNTKVAVGPNARFLVEDVSLASSNRARNFSVRASSGFFRFLSGRSDKSAYKIRTPTATMGIRGTEFDFTVQGNRVTHLLAYGGTVEICNSARSCARVRGGGCSPVGAPRRGTLDIPRTDADKREALLEQFPYAVDQRRVSRQLRVSSGSCNRLIAAAAAPNSPRTASNVPGQTPGQPPSPTPTPGPGPSPSPDPSPSPSNAPGQSASKGGGNSQGQGNSQSSAAGGQGKGHNK